MDDSEIMVEKDVNEVVKHYFHRQGTSTRFSARATTTGLTGKTFFWFLLFFSPFRSGGVVRNYQAKSIRDFLPIYVVQKQMKSLMIGFVLHMNNNLKQSVFHEKNPLDCGQAIFLYRSILYIKNIGRSVTQRCVIFQT